MPREDISSGLFLNCVLLHHMKRRGIIDASHDAWIAKITAILKTVLRDKAKAICDRTLGFVCSEDAPGYLYYASNNIRVYFPWLIVDDLPSKAVLDYLIAVAAKIKIGHLSFFCLSGSSLYFGSLKAITDIDFLEYQEHSSADPCDPRCPEGFGILRNGTRYIEYVAETPFYGVAEITNKIVVIDNMTAGPAASKESSPYQEAPLAGTPRVLYDPIVLGGYIEFLSKNAISLLDKDAPKAAKRLLPLSRLIEDRKITASILNAFDSKSVQDALRVRQKVDLIQKLHGSDNSLDQFAELARADIAKVRGEPSTKAELYEKEQELIDSLSGAVRHIAVVNFDKLEAFSGV